jgi:hypothetical protein
MRQVSKNLQGNNLGQTVGGMEGRRMQQAEPSKEEGSSE